MGGGEGTGVAWALVQAQPRNGRPSVWPGPVRGATGPHPAQERHWLSWKRRSKAATVHYFPFGHKLITQRFVHMYMAKIAPSKSHGWRELGVGL